MATQYPRRKTQQGGNPWLARTSPGQPNTSAMGFNNWNPQTGGKWQQGAVGPWKQGQQDWAPVGPYPYPGPLPGGGGSTGPSPPHQMPGGTPGPDYGGGGRPGTNPNSLIGAEGHDPLAKLRYWAAQGWLTNPAGTGFQYAGNNALQQFLGGGGGGGGQWTNPGGRPNPTTGGGGVGIPGGGGPGPVTGPPNGGGGGDVTPNPTGGGDPDMSSVDWSKFNFDSADYAAMAQEMGLPLDSEYIANLKMLADSLSSGRMNALNRFNTGSSQLNYYKDQGNRQIDSSMAARGLFGSGIERRNERMLSNDVAMQQMGLQNERTQGEAGVQGDYRRGLMEALLQLANRQAIAGAQGYSAAPRF